MKPPDSGWRIPKMDGPDPGSYNFSQSFDNTQKPRLLGSAASKSRRVGFVEQIANLYKNNPAIGKYADGQDKGLRLQSKPKQFVTQR